MITTWVALPGLMCPPRDFGQVAALLAARGARLWALDQWRVPLSAPPDVIAAAWRRSLESGAAPDAVTRLGTVGLVGHSMGATTAVRLALAAAPGGCLEGQLEVGALVLLDPMTPAGPTPRWAWRVATARARHTGGTDYGRLDAQGAFSFPRPWDHPSRVTRTSELMRRLLGRSEPVSMTAEFAASWQLAREVSDGVGRTSGPLAPSITQLTGMRSGARFLSDQRAYARGLGARLVGLKGCGHLIPLERPAAVAAELLDA